jgi:hypothetical protein
VRRERDEREREREGEREGEKERETMAHLEPLPRDGASF